LPDETVRQFRDSLPPSRTREGRPAPAELDPTIQNADPALGNLRILALGSQRARDLTGRELYGFQGRDPADIYEQLAPTWLAERLDEWSDRSIRDLARWMTEVLLNRSQRLALAKARLTQDGTLRVPTRVHTRDEFVFRDSDEGTGAVSLRWDQLVVSLHRCK
jgi:hypothetical protein